MKYNIEQFINKLVEEFEGFNEYVSQDENKIDTPYILAPLFQCIHSDQYEDFLLDLEKWSDYGINIIKPNPDSYNEVCSIFINLLKYNNKENEDGVTCYDNYEYADYSYEIKFGYEERYWGYCDCKLGDKDYREDKECCGHGCDWTAPTVTLHKIYNISSYVWGGDQHDYWNFEDVFYKNNKDLAEEKAKKDKENKIQLLEERIEVYKKELEKLLEIEK